MRIRKRFPPASTPDFHLGQSAAAKLKSEAAQTSDPPGQLSDKVMAISDCNTRRVQPEDDNNGEKKKMKLKESGDGETWREEQMKKRASNDSRENNMPYEEECSIDIFMQSSSSSAAAKGDTKALVPLKKRRGGFERSPKEETQISARMKSKTNKKCELSTTQTDKDVAQNINQGSNGTGAKKSKRGSVIMEGSRCSRVNGRGWRCCQPTLVGYALCEHHLGKGRVRSMSSGDLVLQQPLMVTKRRTKVGVVKARSISSLLKQV